MSFRSAMRATSKWFAEPTPGKWAFTVLTCLAGVAIFIFATATRTPDTPSHPTPEDVGLVEPFNPAMGDTDAVLSVQRILPDGSIAHRCTATLVTMQEPPPRVSQWAVTAAHCLTKPSKEHQQARAEHRQTVCGQTAKEAAPDDDSAEEIVRTHVIRGGTKLYARGGVTATIAQVHVAKGWSWGLGDEGRPYDDLAVVKLDRPLNITPIPIGKAAPDLNTHVLVWGWGTNLDRCGDLQPTMRQWGLQVTSKCDAVTQTGKDLCATTHKTAGPCEGTSGAPLLTETDGRVTGIVGVYSRSTGPYCGGAPDVFTSLAGYRDFLTNTMR